MLIYILMDVEFFCRYFPWFFPRGDFWKRWSMISAGLRIFLIIYAGSILDWVLCIRKGCMRASRRWHIVFISCFPVFYTMIISKHRRSLRPAAQACCWFVCWLHCSLFSLYLPLSDCFGRSSPPGKGRKGSCVVIHCLCGRFEAVSGYFGSAVPGWEKVQGSWPACGLWRCAVFPSLWFFREWMDFPEKYLCSWKRNTGITIAGLCGRIAEVAGLGLAQGHLAERILSVLYLGIVVLFCFLNKKRAGRRLRFWPVLWLFLLRWAEPIAWLLGDSLPVLYEWAVSAEKPSEIELCLCGSVFSGFYGLSGTCSGIIRDAVCSSLSAYFRDSCWSGCIGSTKDEVWKTAIRRAEPQRILEEDIQTTSRADGWVWLLWLV